MKLEILRLQSKVNDLLDKSVHIYDEITANGGDQNQRNDAHCKIKELSGSISHCLDLIQLIESGELSRKIAFIDNELDESVR